MCALPQEGQGWALSCLLQLQGHLKGREGGGEESRTPKPSLWGRSKVVLAPSLLGVKVVTVWSAFCIGLFEDHHSSKGSPEAWGHLGVTA